MSRISALVFAAALAAAGVTVSPAVAAGTCEPSSADVDFNADGLPDVVVPQPRATVDGAADAGQVVVYHGGGNGSLTLHQNIPSFPGDAEPGDRFGTSTAVADWNGDGCHDLLIGAAYEDIGSKQDAGIVWVVSGSPAGLVLNSFVSIGLDDDRTGDRFGATVASDGGETFAVGAPGRDDGVTDSGAVYWFWRDGMRTITQDSAGVAGVREPGDRFGEALSLAANTLAVGVPAEDLGSKRDAGAVQLLWPTPTSAGHRRTYSQDSAGVSGTAESGDRFGASVDATWYTAGAGELALAIGVPGESLTSADADHGMVHAWRFDAALESPFFQVTVHQGTAGVAGVPEATDRFGTQVYVSRVEHPGQSTERVGLLVVSPYEGADAEMSRLYALQAFPVTSTPGSGDDWLMPDLYGIPDDARLTTAYAEGRPYRVFLGDAGGQRAYGVPWLNILDGDDEPVFVYHS